MNTMSKKLEEYSKEELIEAIKHLKKRKKFGLVWESKPENVVEQCRTELPVLEQDETLALSKVKNAPTNLIIEGDNYHALSVLNYTHSGKVDVIYIDPPYNTGAKDWKYNNRYVDSNDTYRHSKWLNMMRNRLILAKSLLTKTGVMIVTIDDYEAATLGLLLDELFPDKDRATVVIKYNPAGTARNGFSRNHEYAYFMLNKGQEVEKRPVASDVRDQNLRRHGSGAMRHESPTMFYPIYVDKKTLEVTGCGETPEKDFHPIAQTIEHENFYEIWPIDDKDIEKRWYFGRERVASRGKEELSTKWYKNRLHVYFHTDNEAQQKFPSVWIGSEYDAGAHGGSLVKKMIDTQFPFPKSIHAVKDCLKAIVKSNPDAIVLDFFAGSGTTGHAVMQMNEEDDGNRKFILCTNNEGNIAVDVTYPRIKAAINGYSDIAGIDSNLRYFKTSFVSKSDVSDDTRYLLVQRSTEMICVRENTFSKLEDNISFKVYENSSHYTAILFNIDKLNELKSHLTELENKKVNIYVFSLTNDTYDDDFSDLALPHSLCPIPESILEVYRRIFKENPWN